MKVDRWGGEIEGLSTAPYSYGEWIAFEDQDEMTIKITPEIIRTLYAYIDEHEQLPENQNG